MNLPIPLKSLLYEIVLLARRGGEAVLEIYAQKDFGTSYKADDSPVTHADLASHRLILSGLQMITPHLPILSEESEEIPYEMRREWKTFWLVDPLDGTKEFIKRNNEFTVNIALVEEDIPVLGVVHAPALGITYYGAKGIGAFKRADGKETGIHVDGYHQETLKIVVSRSHAGKEAREFVQKIGRGECFLMGSALKFCMVADGSAHLCPKFGSTMEWDTAAVQCIVEAAGGSVTDLRGIPLRYNKPNLQNPYFMVSGSPPFPWQQYIDHPAF